MKKKTCEHGPRHVRVYALNPVIQIVTTFFPFKWRAALKWKFHMGASQLSGVCAWTLTLPTLCANACTYLTVFPSLLWILRVLLLVIFTHLAASPRRLLPLSLCCCPSFSQALDASTTPITAANIRSVKSHFYHLFFFFLFLQRRQRKELFDADFKVSSSSFTASLLRELLKQLMFPK